MAASVAEVETCIDLCRFLISRLTPTDERWHQTGCRPAENSRKDTLKSALASLSSGIKTSTGGPVVIRCESCVSFWNHRSFKKSTTPSTFHEGKFGDCGDHSAEVRCPIIWWWWHSTSISSFRVRLLAIRCLSQWWDRVRKEDHAESCLTYLGSICHHSGHLIFRGIWFPAWDSFVHFTMILARSGM